MRRDVYAALNWRMKYRLHRTVSRWLDKLYQRYLAFMLGQTVPLEEVAVLRKNGIGPEQIHEFCDRFLLRGYDKTFNNMSRPPKKLPRPRWTNINDATAFWVSCTRIGHVQSYGKGEIEVTCE